LTDESDAAAQYASRAGANREVVTDGFGEAEAEYAGISSVRRTLRLVFTAFVMMVLGATAFGAYDWSQTRSNPEIVMLSDRQAGMLEYATDDGVDSFNNGAAKTLVSNGYKIVAQSVDGNTGNYYIIFAKCDTPLAECAKRLDESKHPVVYLGIPYELPELQERIYFIATKVRVDFPLGDGQVRQCSVYRGKAEVGDPWPLSFKLPQTIAALQGFNGDSDFADKSPDNGVSFWECAVQ
jgi:hypothetical protein